jgi:crotonobetainyl-CoA:carnitine CoA-transferase CaiB-like acyl-CoA transferase
LQKIFKDLKVLELAGVLAGPSVGFFFAELGAKVIKIENPKTRGDVTRSWKLKNEDPQEETSAYFWSVNALKEIIFLDISQQKDLQRLYDLVKDCDIVITNYKRGDDEKLKADYKTLSQINPRLIYASINGFGSDSPRTAYDLILQAESGFMYMNGEPGSKPVKMPVALIDLLAAHQLKEAILISLLKRYESGKGAHVSVSLFQSALASLVNQATNWLIGGQIAQPIGSLHPNIAPYGEIFETKDKQLITFAIGSNRQFAALCDLVRYPALSKDKSFATNQLRVKNRSQLYSIIYDYIRKFSFKEMFDLCLEKEIPLGKIRNMKEVFELPEAKQMLIDFKHNNKNLSTVSGIAFRFHED